MRILHHRKAWRLWKRFLPYDYLFSQMKISWFGGRQMIRRLILRCSFISIGQTLLSYRLLLFNRLLNLLSISYLLAVFKCKYKQNNQSFKWAMTCQNRQNVFAPSKNSGQPGHPPRLIRAFAVRWVSNYGSKFSSYEPCAGTDPPPRKITSYMGFYRN